MPAQTVSQDVLDGGARLNAYGEALARCRAIGREAGTYAAYEACEKEAGL